MWQLETVSRWWPTVAIVAVALLATVHAVPGQEDSQEYAIRSLSGEPDYKSVNLTWEVENVRASSAGGRHGRAFTVYYCEMQNWGPHRCRSKVLTDSDDPQDGEYGSSKQYSMKVKNLRMATKYSFHVKSQLKRGDQRITGRAEHGDEDHQENAINQGQTIIIPTKGFSAHATQCLPDASEIEVETGPYFGGRIAAENGNCGIQGDATSSQETYMMRIDHEKCGSKVSTRDLTVETYITVQENLGILTHSTRRFVVVCTFQPDTLTVRARLALPGKGGAAPVPNSEWWPANGRNGRVRQFNMVDKSSLVLKGSEEERTGAAEEAVPAEVREVPEHPVANQEDNEVQNKPNPLRDAKYAPIFESLVTEDDTDAGIGLVDGTEKEEEVGTSANQRITPERRSSGSTVFDVSGLLISACLAVIMIGAFIYLLQREIKKQRITHQHQQMERSPQRVAI